MALPQGLNLRANPGFVTDVGDEFWVDAGGASYPTTSTQGNTVGWEVAAGTLGARDRNSGNDRRLAGIDFTTAAKQDLRVDLPSVGSYDIRQAAGDATYSQLANVELFDGSVSLGVLSSGSTGAANSFKDATNVVRTAAAWAANNAPVTKTFTTTICRFRLGDGANLNVLAHAHIAASAASGPFPLPDRGLFKDSLSTHLRM